MIEQQLIVISLRDRLFLEEKHILQNELAEGWRVKDIKLGVGEHGKHGFMTVLLEREWVEQKQVEDVRVYTQSGQWFGDDEQDMYSLDDGVEIPPPEYNPDDVAFNKEPEPPVTEDVNESDVKRDGKDD
jgi:hypothetical protein